MDCVTRKNLQIQLWIIQSLDAVLRFLAFIRADDADFSLTRKVRETARRSNRLQHCHVTFIDITVRRFHFAIDEIEAVQDFDVDGQEFIIIRDVAVMNFLFQIGALFARSLETLVVEGSNPARLTDMLLNWLYWLGKVRKNNQQRIPYINSFKTTSIDVSN